MSYGIYPVFVDTILVCLRDHMVKCRAGIVNVRLQSIPTVAAPASGIMEKQHVKSLSPEGVSEILVFLVSWNAVKQDYERMRAVPSGGEQRREKASLSSRDKKLYKSGEMFFICRIIDSLSQK